MRRLGQAAGVVYGVLWVRGLGLLLSMVLIAPILVYQRFISPALPPSCKYHPSCSQYAVEALWAHGPFKGLALATARIARCNPWSGGGVNPIPSRGHWRASVLTDGRARLSTSDITPSARTVATTTIQGA